MVMGDNAMGVEPANENMRSRKKQFWIFVIGVLVVLAVVTAYVGLIYRLDPAFQLYHPAQGNYLLAALNAIPFAIIALLILALTRRPWFAFWVGVLLILLLYTINELKLHSLETPIMPDDFALIGMLGKGDGLMARYIPTSPHQLLRYGLAVVITLVAIFAPPRLRLRPWSRCAFALVAFALGATMLLGTKPWPEIYSKDRLHYVEWTPAKTAERAGLSASLLMYYWDFSADLPAPDKAAAAALVASHASVIKPNVAALPTTAELPDIVILQSESFFDPARLKGFEPSQVIPIFRQIETQSVHGDLWVPTFGGGTVRTEFEVLTGIALRYFPEIRYPYYGLTAKPMPSLAAVLDQHGYRTIAIHPNDRTFWNRAAALSSLGFDEFDDDNTFSDAPHVGYYVSDDALVDHILKKLDGSGPPKFIFAISMENHGPYDRSPDVDEKVRDAEPVPAGVTGNAAARLRNYLYHLGNADRSLGRLIATLSQRPRRTIVLFYGDHLPALHTVYQTLGFDDGNLPTEQPVPYILYDTATRQSTLENTASYFLPSAILNAAGIHDAYFELLGAVRAETTFGPNYTPAEDNDLGALMEMRQLGEWPSSEEVSAVAQPKTPATP